jgi:hypothetical protein
MFMSLFPDETSFLVIVELLKPEPIPAAQWFLQFVRSVKYGRLEGHFARESSQLSQPRPQGKFLSESAFRIWIRIEHSVTDL